LVNSRTQKGPGCGKRGRPLKNLCLGKKMQCATRVDRKEKKKKTKREKKRGGAPKNFSNVPQRKRQGVYKGKKKCKNLPKGRKMRVENTKKSILCGAARNLQARKKKRIRSLEKNCWGRGKKRKNGGAPICPIGEKKDRSEGSVAP